MKHLPILVAMGITPAGKPKSLEFPYPYGACGVAFITSNDHNEPRAARLPVWQSSVFFPGTGASFISSEMHKPIYTTSTCK